MNYELRTMNCFYLSPDSAGLVNPRDVTVDPDGNLYIADTGNNAIRMVVGGAL